jgi:hypothetical protein
MRRERKTVVVYEFYCRDENGETHFIGALPESRKNQQRGITTESIIKWGTNVIGENIGAEEIFFTEVVIE